MEKGGTKMQALMNGLYTYVTTFQPLVHFAIAMALMVVGVMFIVPSEKVRNVAKEAVPFILIGGAIVLTASQLASEFVGNFTFGDDSNALSGAAFYLKSYMI